jgi:hypothetical protein
MATASLEAAKAQIRRMIEILRRSGDPADAACAEGFEQCLSSMVGRFETKETLFKIGELCHPKALGDRFIPGLTYLEWAHELELLEDRCATAFNELERSSP